MFKSATRVYLFTLVLTLCFITIYALIKADMERFTVVIGLFGGVIGAIVNHFSGKSARQEIQNVSKEETVDTTITTEK